MIPFFLLQTTSTNRQGNLTSFFDIAPGSGSYAPRKRQPYGSKRLQQVVTDFQKQQAKRKTGSTSTAVPDEADDFISKDDEPAVKKRKSVTNRKSQTKTNTKATLQKRPGSVTNQRGKGPGSRARVSSSIVPQEQLEGSDSGDEYVDKGSDDRPSVTKTSKPRLRPRARPVAKGTRKPDRYDVLAGDSDGS